MVHLDDGTRQRRGSWGRRAGIVLAFAGATVAGLAGASMRPTAARPASATADVSSTTANQAQPGSTISSKSFSVPTAGDTVLAFVGSDGPRGAGRQSIAKLTAPGLTFHLVVRANASNGDAEVWAASAPMPVTASTVTATRAVGGFDGMVTVTVVSGTQPGGGIGASAAASAASGAPTVSLTTTAAASLVFGIGNDWASATPRTPTAGQTLVSQFLDRRSGDSYWTQRIANQTASRGVVVTLGDAAPTTDEFNIAAVEVRLADATGPTPTSAPTATSTPTPAVTPTPAPSATPRPTATSTATPTPTPTSTPTPIPTPTLTPTPTPAANQCMANPSSCGFPDSTNTGVPPGTPLTASGSLSVSTPGAVVSNLDIAGTVDIAASNVTVRNSRIHADLSASYVVYVEAGASVTITDSDLSGGSEAVIAFDNWTAVRVNIHDFGADGVKFGSNVRLQDSYIHNFATEPGAHADGGQLQSGETNIVIQHNTVDAVSASGVGANSAFFIAPDLGPNSAGPLTITNNLLGGGNYTVYVVDGNNGQYIERGITFSNNRMADNFGYGHLDVTDTEAPYIIATGNVDDANGAAITV